MNRVSLGLLGLIVVLQLINLWSLHKLRPAPTPVVPPVSSIQLPVSATPASSSAVQEQLTAIRDELVKLRADQRDLTQVLGLTTSSPTPTPITTNLTVDANYPVVNVYDQPLSSATVVGHISPGRAYPYSTLQNNWYHITLPDGTQAWVEAKYVKPL